MATTSRWRIAAQALLFSTTLLLAACGGSDDPPPPTPAPPAPTPSPPPPPPAAVAPSITAQPAAVSVTEGQTAAFSVTATGTAPLAYQWRRNGADIAGATAATYSLAATLAD
ncbi:MAG: immunoglobulin domain-containing protein, partial [Burkholderiaceae bacterium]|nr:immunoglobulin domain-containing protein [Burkholderiaceae bacterium]